MGIFLAAFLPYSEPSFRLYLFGRMKKRNNNSNGKNCVPIFFPYSNKIKKAKKSNFGQTNGYQLSLYVHNKFLKCLYIYIYIYIYILYHVCNYTKTAGLTLSLFGAKKIIQKSFFLLKLLSLCNSCAHYLRRINAHYMRARAHTHTHTNIAVLSGFCMRNRALMSLKTNVRCLFYFQNFDNVCIYK